MKHERVATQARGEGAGPGGGERVFRRTMIRLTLAFWSCVYILFTLRAVARPHPYFMTQAGLRVVMMMVGAALCAGLYVALKRLERKALHRQLPAIAALTAAATVAYVNINYAVFYLLPGLWQPRHGAIAAIGSYLIELIWLFAAWVLLYFYARHRHLRARQAPGRSPLRNIWVKQRDSEVCVPVDRIERIEAEGDYVRIRTPDRSYLMRSTMRGMEDALEGALFVRIHRRIIVPTRLVQAIERRPDSRVELRLTNGAVVPVGRHYLRRLKEIVACA